jgi:CheY-like chemotaxis protein
MDGIETTRRIRACPVALRPATPIVALTAHAMQGDRQRCLDAGMNSYLVKPVEAKALYRALEAAASAEMVLDDAEPDSTGPPAAPVVDLDEALRRVGGDYELLAELAHLFREDTPGIMAEIAAALAAADAHALAPLAHRLKGSLGALAAHPAAAEALALERAAGEGELGPATEIWNRLSRELDRLVAELAALESGVVVG